LPITTNFAEALPPDRFISEGTATIVGAPANMPGTYFVRPQNPKIPTFAVPEFRLLPCPRA
jgi:hypothetical protein